jgi:hypothetical protein
VPAASGVPELQRSYPQSLEARRRLERREETEPEVRRTNGMEERAEAAEEAK